MSPYWTQVASGRTKCSMVKRVSFKFCLNWIEFYLKISYFIFSGFHGRVLGGTPTSVKKHPWSIIFYEYTQRQCPPLPYQPDCKPWEPSTISRGQEISKAIFLKSHCPKRNLDFLRVSALASKMCENKQKLTHFYYLY